MTFPQPSADTAAIEGGQYFRLNTLVSSMGDLYESAQGAHAFALGPDSDIASARISYWDASVARGVNSIQLSPDRSFAGLVAARNETTYIKSSGRPGRILIGIDDIFNTTFRPLQLFNGLATPEAVGRSFDPALDTIDFVQPTLDVIQYFANPPSLIPQRSDKTRRFQYVHVAPQPANFGISILAVPMYGRKSGYINVKNLAGIDPLGVQLGVVRLSTSGGPPASAPVGAVQAVLRPFESVFSGAAITYKFRASTDGLWDLLLIELGGGNVITGPSFGYTGGAVPIIVTLSDDQS